MFNEKNGLNQPKTALINIRKNFRCIIKQIGNKFPMTIKNSSRNSLV